MDLDPMSRKKRRTESRKKTKNGQKNNEQAQAELGEGCLITTNHMNIMLTPNLLDERNEEGKVLQLVTDETSSFPVAKALPNLSHESDKAHRNANSFPIDKIQVRDADLGVDSTQCASFLGIEQNGAETSQNLVELIPVSRKKRKRGSQKKIMTLQDHGCAQEQPEDGCCTSISANSSVMGSEVQGTILGPDLPVCLPFAISEQMGVETAEDAAVVKRASQKKSKRSQKKKDRALRNSEQAGKPSSSDERDMEEKVVIEGNTDFVPPAKSEMQDVKLGVESTSCPSLTIEQISVERVKDPAVVNQLSQEKSRTCWKKKTRALQNSEQAGKLPEESCVTSTSHMNNLSMQSPSDERDIEEKFIIVGNIDSVPTVKSEMQDFNLGVESTSCPPATTERIGVKTVGGPAVVNQLSQEKSKKSQKKKKKTRAVQNSEQAGKLPEESCVTSTGHMNNLSMLSPSDERDIEEKVIIVGNIESVPIAKSKMQGVNLGVESTTFPPVTTEQIVVKTIEDPAVANQLSQGKSKKSWKKKTWAMQNSEQGGKLPEGGCVTSTSLMNNLSMRSPSDERDMEEKVIIVGNTDTVPIAQGEMQDVNLRVESKMCPPTIIEQIGVETAEDPAVVNRVSQEKSKKSRKKKTRAVQNSEQAGNLAEESCVTSTGHLSMPEEKVIVLGSSGSVPITKSKKRDINLGVESTTCPTTTVEQMGVGTVENPIVVNQVSQEKLKRSQKKKTSAMQKGGKLSDESCVTSTSDTNILSMPSSLDERDTEEKVIVLEDADSVPITKSKLQDADSGVDSTQCPSFPGIEQNGTETSQNLVQLSLGSREKRKRRSQKKIMTMQDNGCAQEQPEDGCCTSINANSSVMESEAPGTILGRDLPVCLPFAISEEMGVETVEDPAVVNRASLKKSKRSQKKKDRAPQNSEQAGKPSPSDERDMEEKVVIVGNTDFVPTAKTEMQDVNLRVESTMCHPATIEQIGGKTVEDPAVVDRLSQEKSKRSQKKKTRAVQNSEQAGKPLEESCVSSTGHMSNLSVPSPSGERGMEEKVIIVCNTDSVLTAKSKMQDVNLGVESTMYPPATIEQIGVETAEDPEVVNRVSQKKSKRSQKKKTRALQESEQAGKLPEESCLSSTAHMNNLSMPSPSNERGMEEKVIIVGNTDSVPTAKSEVQDVNLGVVSKACLPATIEQIGMETAKDPAVMNQVSQEKSKRSQKKKTRAVQKSEEAGKLPEESCVSSTGHMNNLSMQSSSAERDMEEKVILVGNTDSVQTVKGEMQDVNLGVESTTCPSATIEQIGVEIAKDAEVVNRVSQEKSKRSRKKKTREALPNGEQAGKLPEESCVTSTSYTNILSMPSSSDERDTEENAIVLCNGDSVPITKIKLQDANLGAKLTTCPSATIEEMGGEATKNSVEMNMVIKKKTKQSNRNKPNTVVTIHQVPKEAPLTNTDGVNVMSTVRLSNGKDSEGKVISLGAAENERVSLAVDNEEDNSSEISHISLVREPASHLKKKLLILDINGLLADIVRPPPKNCTPDAKFAGHAIFKRPFCRDFLKFCFERFEVGVWSSRSRVNVQRAIDHLMGDMKHKLLLCWDLSHCTATKFKSREHKHKPIVFKDLRKIWEKQYRTLRWQEGEYDASNTLLLDDSPYKALLNPRHTAIFPHSYKFQEKDDCSLGPGGDLRVYLEKLAEAENTPNYVANHPFGQTPITRGSEHWDFYQKVINSLNPHQPRDNVSG